MMKSRKSVLCLTVVVACSVIYLKQRGFPKEIMKKRQPHILFILADDLGWNDVGYHSSTHETPNINKLAAEGVKLENYYVQPICTPSRSQLMTGLYQTHTGMQHDVIELYQPWGLPLKFPTLADKLKEVGYSTHLVGKWHLGHHTVKHTPTYRGFDSFYGIYTASADYWKHDRCAGGYCALDFHNNTDVIRTADGKYASELYVERIKKIVAEHDRSKPLFMYFPMQLVHGPHQVPQQFIDKYKTEGLSKATYMGMVSYMDEVVKNVTDTFKRQGLWENTILIFSTDNGAGGKWQNLPFKGAKFTLWEGGIHGVGFVNSPLLQMKNYISHQFIHISDWFPTLVHLAGGSTEGMKLDGFDQWKTISMNRPSPRKELLHNIDPLCRPVGKRLYPDSFDNRIRAAIRVGDMKLMTGWPEHLRMQQLWKKNMMTTNMKNIWLFNITADPTEHHDLSETHPHIVKQLLDRLAYYNSTAVPCAHSKWDPKGYPRNGAWLPWLSGEKYV